MVANTCVHKVGRRPGAIVSLGELGVHEAHPRLGGLEESAIQQTSVSTARHRVVIIQRDGECHNVLFRDQPRLQPSRAAMPFMLVCLAFGLSSGLRVAVAFCFAIVSSFSLRKRRALLLSTRYIFHGSVRSLRCTLQGTRKAPHPPGHERSAP